MVTDSLEILDTRLVAAANDIFGIEFTQGCFRNDDICTQFSKLQKTECDTAKADAASQII
jgi:hypothetical protein